MNYGWKKWPKTNGDSDRNTSVAEYLIVSLSASEPPNTNQNIVTRREQALYGNANQSALSAPLWLCGGFFKCLQMWASYFEPVLCGRGRAGAVRRCKNSALPSSGTAAHTHGMGWQRERERERERMERREIKGEIKRGRERERKQGEIERGRGRKTSIESEREGSAGL